jgi:hypothetical protein
VIAPSHDAAARISRHFPAVAPLVWPHAETPEQAPPRGKVLVLGGLSPAKGMALVEACARDAAARELPLCFRVLGHVALPVDGEAGLPLSFTGEYPEGMLASLIAQERGDAILFPAQWPETYSYTLTAAIASGLPIVATNLGAFPERLADTGSARILGWDEDAARFNDALVAALGVASVAPPAPAIATPRDGCDRYRDRYLEAIAARPATTRAPAIAPPGLAEPPDEWIPEATLAELFDDGVRCGNGRSASLLRERVARADRELADADALRARLESTNARLAAAGDRGDILARDLALARAEQARVAVQLERAAAQVAALEASTSWRLTAPLRALVRRLRG